MWIDKLRAQRKAARRGEERAVSAKRERKVRNARGGREEAIRLRRKIPPIKRGIKPERVLSTREE